MMKPSFAQKKHADLVIPYQKNFTTALNLLRSAFTFDEMEPQKSHVIRHSFFMPDNESSKQSNKNNETKKLLTL